MTEPTPEAVVEFLCEPKPPAAPKESSGEGAPSEPHPLETRRDALVERLLAAGFDEGRRPAENLRRFHHDPKVVVLIPDGHPCEVEGDFATLLDKAEEQCARVERAAAPPATVEDFLRDLESGDGEPSVGDVVDAQPEPTVVGGVPLFIGAIAFTAELSGRWGHVHDPPLDGLAAPGPTVAELQQQFAAERARADLCDAEAVSQRQRAEAVEAELFEVDRALHTLGAYGTGPTKERLLQVLSPEDRRAILEFDVAEARMDLARLRARRLNPAPPEKLAEYAAKVATLDARIAALDAG